MWNFSPQYHHQHTPTVTTTNCLLWGGSRTCNKSCTITVTSTPVSPFLSFHLPSHHHHHQTKPSTTTTNPLPAGWFHFYFDALAKLVYLWRAREPIPYCNALHLPRHASTHTHTHTTWEKKTDFSKLPKHEARRRGRSVSAREWGRTLASNSVTSSVVSKGENRYM